jgi:hypothetical protein
MRMDRPLAGVTLLWLTPLVSLPPGIAGERDNGGNSEEG